MRALPLLLGAVLLCGCTSPPPVVQPIEFSHKGHVEKGLPCTACHESVETAAAAGMPTTATCMMCHQGAMTESAEEEKVRQYAATDSQIPWRRLYQTAGHVYFSHRRHVTLGGIECAECHGQIADSTAPPRHPAVPVHMDTCMKCHAQRGADNDCNTCHR